MRKLRVLTLMLWLTNLGLAQQQPLPTIRIFPDDVVQDSIRQFRVTTNNFALRWTYTEAGAKKMLAFREAHEGNKVRTVVGNFVTRPTEIIFRPMPPAFTNYTQWKESWLKRRTDKFFGVSEDDVKAINADLKANDHGSEQTQPWLAVPE